MTWSDTTNLYSAELNGRWDLSGRITVLAGVRWLQLNDRLVGTLSPPDQTAPDWKKACPFCDIFHITPGGAAGDYPPFWTTAATNNLYGIQLGVEAQLLTLDRFALAGVVKAGLYDNVASQLTGVSLAKVVYPASATANRLAVAADAGLQLKYRLSRPIVLKIGYTALWLAGVALAPAQVQETYTSASP